MKPKQESVFQKPRNTQTWLSNLKVAAFLATKQIVRSNKGSLILTIAIMSLVFLDISFMGALLSGVQDTLTTQTIDTQFSHIKIESPKNELFIKNVKSLKNKINNLDGVIGSVSHYKVNAKFSYDKRKDGQDIKRGNWSITSIVPNEEKKVTTFYKSIVAGEYLNENDRDKILIGKDVAGGYGSDLIHDPLGGATGLKIGTKINVTYPNGIKREYIVKGIFNTKSLFADSMTFVTEKELADILHTSDQASEILVKTDNLNDVNKYIQELRGLGITKELINPGMEYLGLIKSVTGSFGIIRTIFVGIGLAVAAVTIFIIIFISVVNKRKEIGILKAIGMKKGIIVMSYLLQALFYSLLGIAGGLCILYFVLIPFFIAHPLQLPMGDVYLDVMRKDVITNGIALMIASLISGFIPSWGVAKKSILNLVWGA